jgi:hypothetical protein
MNTRTILALINIMILNLGIIMLINKPVSVELPPNDQILIPIQKLPPPKPIVVNYDITTPMPDYLNYDQTVSKLKEWNKEAPELTEVGVYGKSTNGTDLHYIKISSPASGNKKKVMITACIHGNEPLSASTVMGYIGTILDKYGDDEKITKLIDSRDIYFVPVVSPDSYPQSRYVDGVDPNRDFPTQRNSNKKSVPPVQEIRNLFVKIQPDAVISGHTWGRVYLTPYGDQIRLSPNEDDYQRIIGKMTELSNYRMQRACELYSRPIYGTDVDWYYRNGAFSIVMEFGTHQRIPTMSEIKFEFDKTFEAVLYFIEEAPKVEVKFFAEQEWRTAA